MRSLSANGCLTRSARPPTGGPQNEIHPPFSLRGLLPRFWADPLDGRSVRLRRCQNQVLPQAPRSGHACLPGKIIYGTRSNRQEYAVRVGVSPRYRPSRCAGGRNLLGHHMGGADTMSLTTESTEVTEWVMARIKCPVSVSYFADIAEVLSKRAKADGRTAFTRQIGDCLEIYSIPDAKGATR